MGGVALTKEKCVAAAGYAVRVLGRIMSGIMVVLVHISFSGWHLPRPGGMTMAMVTVLTVAMAMATARHSYGYGCT